MNDLLQMMGGDVGALQALLNEGDAESSDDEAYGEEIDEDSSDSDSDDDSPHVVDEEAIGAEDSDSDQSSDAAEQAVVAQVPAPMEEDEAAPLDDGLPHVEDSVDDGGL